VGTGRSFGGGDRVKHFLQFAAKTAIEKMLRLNVESSSYQREGGNWTPGHPSPGKLYVYESTAKEGGREGKKGGRVSDEKRGNSQ